MRTVRYLLWALAATLAVVCVIQTVYQQRTVDVPRLIVALRTYATETMANGGKLPETVTLEELVRRGHLKSADAKAFEGVQVTFSLAAEEGKPQQILIRARLRDGTEFLQLGDGSAQQAPTAIQTNTHR
jgi:hypothetical protein